MKARAGLSLDYRIFRLADFETGRPSGYKTFWILATVAVAAAGLCLVARMQSVRYVWFPAKFTFCSIA
jgi:hypothetical protein